VASRLDTTARTPFVPLVYLIPRNAEQQPGVDGDISMGMTDLEKRALKGGALFMEMLAAPIPDACRISGLSRSEIYRRLAHADPDRQPTRSERDGLTLVRQRREDLTDGSAS
jgi:hypothetical protein